jgi:phage tail tape-measure protein
MMLGQSFIPIPFLGAFVGGVVGGFLGATGTNIMTKLMNK